MNLNLNLNLNLTAPGPLGLLAPAVLVAPKHITTTDLHRAIMHHLREQYTKGGADGEIAVAAADCCLLYIATTPGRKHIDPFAGTNADLKNLLLSKKVDSSLSRRVVHIECSAAFAEGDDDDARQRACELVVPADDGRVEGVVVRAAPPPAPPPPPSAFRCAPLFSHR